MPPATVILLAQARATRDKAQRARWLAEALNAEDAARRLRAYAEQLEVAARHFEDRAASFQPAADRQPGPGLVIALPTSR